MQPSVQPAPTIYTPEQVEAIRRSNKKKLIWGLVCLIAPTALLIITIIGYAIINFVTGSFSSSNQESTFAQPSTAHTIGNVIIFIIGAISTLTWLPGIIGGIILLATRKKVQLRAKYFSYRAYAPLSGVATSSIVISRTAISFLAGYRRDLIIAINHSPIAIVGSIVGLITLLSANQRHATQDIIGLAPYAPKRFGRLSMDLSVFAACHSFQRFS